MNSESTTGVVAGAAGAVIVLLVLVLIAYHRLSRPFKRNSDQDTGISFTVASSSAWFTISPRAGAPSAESTTAVEIDMISLSNASPMHLDRLDAPVPLSQIPICSDLASLLPPMPAFGECNSDDKMDDDDLNPDIRASSQLDMESISMGRLNRTDEDDDLNPDIRTPSELDTFVGSSNQAVVQDAAQKYSLPASASSSPSTIQVVEAENGKPSLPAALQRARLAASNRSRISDRGCSISDTGRAALQRARARAYANRIKQAANVNADNGEEAKAAARAWLESRMSHGTTPTPPNATAYDIARDWLEGEEDDLGASPDHSAPLSTPTRAAAQGAERAKLESLMENLTPSGLASSSSAQELASVSSMPPPRQVQAPVIVPVVPAESSFDIPAPVALQVAGSPPANGSERMVAAAQAAAWVSAITTCDLPEGGSNANEMEGSLQRWLCSGVLLCELMNCIRPGSVRKTSASASPFMQKDNVFKFLAACAAVGVPAHNIFQPVDLLEARDMRSVIGTLHALARVAVASDASLPGMIDQSRALCVFAVRATEDDRA